MLFLCIMWHYPRYLSPLDMIGCAVSVLMYCETHLISLESFRYFQSLFLPGRKRERRDEGERTSVSIQGPIVLRQKGMDRVRDLEFNLFLRACLLGGKSGTRDEDERISGSMFPDLQLVWQEGKKGGNGLGERFQILQNT